MLEADQLAKDCKIGWFDANGIVQLFTQFLGIADGTTVLRSKYTIHRLSGLQIVLITQAKPSNTNVKEKTIYYDNSAFCFMMGPNMDAKVANYINNTHQKEIFQVEKIVNEHRATAARSTKNLIAYASFEKKLEKMREDAKDRARSKLRENFQKAEKNGLNTEDILRELRVFKAEKVHKS